MKQNNVKNVIFKILKVSYANFNELNIHSFNNSFENSRSRRFCPRRFRSQRFRFRRNSSQRFRYHALQLFVVFQNKTTF